MTAPDELPNSTPPVEPVSSTPETASAPSGPVSEASVPAKSEPAVVLPAVTPPTPPEPAPEPQPVPAVPKSPQPQEASRMAQDFQIRRAQVDTVLKLFEDGASVPYVARYCQEQTGGLPEELLRRIHDRLKALKALAERKQTILKSIAMMGKLNDDLTQAILTAEHPKRLDDLYLPFKPKKKSVAGDAREKGLEPLAKAIWTRDAAVEKLDEVLPGMVDAWKQLHDVGDVLAGVKHILAEYVSERPDVRGALRAFLWDTAVLRSKRVETLPEGKGKDFH
jgi:transcriptional accessory protein Tex/SPT6